MQAAAFLWLGTKSRLSVSLVAPQRDLSLVLFCVSTAALCLSTGALWFLTAARYIDRSTRNMLCFFRAWCSPAVVFFVANAAAGQARVCGYTTMHVWIPTELRGGAVSSERRWAGSFCHGVVFRLTETIRCMEYPTFCFCSLKTIS